MAQSTHRSINRIKTPAKTAYAVSLLPAWLLDQGDRANEHCVMIDLFSGGAALLVPEDQATHAKTFDLVFMSPDNAGEILVTLPAEQRWRDEMHTPDHIKIGVAFLEMNLIKHQVIDAMISIFNTKCATIRPDISNKHYSTALNAQE